MKKERQVPYWDIFFRSAPGNINRSMNDLFMLLCGIDRTGSIRKAAAEAGFSYRHSWNLLQESESWFGIPLLETSAGGKSGGGTLLTGQGRSLASEYSDLSAKMKLLITNSPFKPAASPSRKKALHTVQAAESRGNHIVLATTIEPAASGLLDFLEEKFFLDTNIRMRHVAAGSGQALDFAREGRVDITLTHSPAAEEAFLDQGWGIDPLDLMESPFITAGPAADPAGAAFGAVENTSALYRCIAQSGVPFLSRNDDSGTHRREREIWRVAGCTPDEAKYLTYSGAEGNLGMLREAERLGACCLTDQASYVLFSSEKSTHISSGDMAGLLTFSGSPDLDDPLMKNCFRLILVNPERFQYVRYEGAAVFRKWVMEKGKLLISSFGADRFGAPLFTVS